MKSTWRYIYSGACSPAHNMAIDEAILIAHSEGKVPPTLRFYRWKPASLTIGYFQKAQDEVNFSALQESGIGFVRRPTGGRAVLHDQELTYSIIVSESYPGIPRGVTDAYRVLSEGLLNGFQILGLDAEMVNLAAEDEKLKYAASGSSVCFDSPSWYELVVEGRKIAGSAQTRQKGVVLQHGSILIDVDAELMFSLLRFDSEKLKRRLLLSFATKATAINDLLRARQLPAVSHFEVEEAFKFGIAKGMGIELESAELTPYEKELADRLAAEKYATDNWNLRR